MAIESIIEWISNLPDWQQDALRRLALSYELDDANISAILANVKQAQGLPQNDLHVLEPFATQHFQSSARTAPLVHLCSIGNVKNANRLAPNQTLRFAVDGITLVYGHNGSGKSGYCRILKQLCRAAVKDAIHSDVFSSDTSAPAEALIRYKAAGAQEVSSVQWRDGEDGPTEIAHLSVFDGHNVRLYVDKRNQIDYLPREIDLLARFGDLLTKLNGILSEDIKIAQRRLNIDITASYTPGTEVHDLVSQLNSTTSIGNLPAISEINKIGSWNKELEQELDELQQSLRNDPKALFDRCSRLQSILSKLIEELTDARTVLSQEKSTELEQAVSHAHRLDEAASLAATKLFKDEPLQDVASDPWRLMFQHAREFSKMTYPEVTPPAAREGDLCMLCQQPLTQEAAARLRRFEAYVSGRARKDADTAAQDRDEKRATIERYRLRSAEDVKKLLGEYAGLSDEREKIAVAVEEFFSIAHERQKKLLSAVESRNFSSIIELDSSVIDRLRTDSAALKADAEVYDGEVTDDARRELRKERLATLQDRKYFTRNLDRIRSLRSDLEEIYKLQSCVTATGTREVSLQVNKLRREIVTAELRNRIRQETNNFDLKHIPLLINDSSRKGGSGFTVALGAQGRVANREILSEGEQRALGLACFLADIGRQPVKHGIIIDDPVSSLDHIRLRRVAARLVEEAALGRQVIVFTHNLVFFRR